MVMSNVIDNMANIVVDDGDIFKMRFLLCWEEDRLERL